MRWINPCLFVFVLFCLTPFVGQPNLVHSLCTRTELWGRVLPSGDRTETEGEKMLLTSPVPDTRSVELVPSDSTRQNEQNEKIDTICLYCLWLLVCALHLTCHCEMLKRILTRGLIEICLFHILTVMGKKLGELFQRGRTEENQEVFFPQAVTK